MYLIVSLVVLLISYQLFKRAAGTMSLYRLNIVSWTFYSELLIFSFLGATLMMLGVPNYLIDRATPEAKLKAYLAVCYVMLFVPIVMIFTQRIFLGGHIAAKIRDYFSRPLIKTNNQAVYWIFLSILATIATAYTYFIIKKIPIIDLLISRSGIDNLELFRQQVGRGFTGNEYIRNFLSLFLAPFVTYVAYAYYRLYRRWLYLFWFLATFAISILAITYNGQKGPIIFFFLSLFFTRIFINGRATRRDFILLFILVSGLVLFTYVIFAGVDLSIATLYGILSRIGMVQFAGMPLAFDVFPYQYSFLNGGGFPTWINNVIGVPHAEMARLLMQVYNPAGVEQGTAGVINTLFIADAWANFGWVGIILAPIYLGVLIQVIYHRLITIPKSPVNVALNGYFMTSFQITGGLIGFIWNPIWIFLAFILLLGLGFSSPVPQTNSGGNGHPNELNFER